MRKKPAFTYYSQRGRGYSEEYQAVLDAGIGTAPSASQKTKQNTLVTDLKSAGIWDLLDVFYVFATDGDSDFATLNWKAPGSFRLSKVNSPTFTSNQGFTGNASNMHLTSTYDFSTGTNYTLNAASFGYHKITTGASINDIGSDGASATNVIGGVAAGNNYYRVNAANPGNAGGIVAAANGFKHYNRSGASADQAYLNGVLIDQSTTAASGIGTGAFTVLRKGAAYSSGQLAMVFVGGNLSSKAASLYSAWNTYFTSL